MGRIAIDRTLENYELIQELAQHSSNLEIIIDFELKSGNPECPICGQEYETEKHLTGIVTKVTTTDQDRWRAIHLVCRED